MAGAALRQEIGGRRSLDALRVEPECGRFYFAAACILYAAGPFPRDMREREAFVAYLRSGQSPEAGMLSDANHSPTHAPAYVLSALELFERGP